MLQVSLHRILERDHPIKKSNSDNIDWRILPP